MLSLANMIIGSSILCLKYDVPTKNNRTVLHVEVNPVSEDTECPNTFFISSVDGKNRKYSSYNNTISTNSEVNFDVEKLENTFGICCLKEGELMSISLLDNLKLRDNKFSTDRNCIISSVVYEDDNLRKQLVPEVLEKFTKEINELIFLEYESFKELFKMLKKQ